MKWFLVLLIGHRTVFFATESKTTCEQMVSQIALYATDGIYAVCHASDPRYFWIKPESPTGTPRATREVSA